MTSARVSDIALSLSSETAAHLVATSRGRCWVSSLLDSPTAAALHQLGLIELVAQERGFVLPITPLGHQVADELVRLHDANVERYRASCGGVLAPGEQSSAPGRDAQ